MYFNLTSFVTLKGYTIMHTLSRCTPLKDCPIRVDWIAWVDWTILAAITMYTLTYNVVVCQPQLPPSSFLLPLLPHLQSLQSLPPSITFSSLYWLWTHLLLPPSCQCSGSCWWKGYDRGQKVCAVAMHVKVKSFVHHKEGKLQKLEQERARETYESQHFPSRNCFQCNQTCKDN